MLCHTAVTHLPARHTLPSPLLTLHTRVLAQMTLARPHLTLWLWSDVMRCFHFKAADFWNLWKTFTLTPQTFLCAHHSVLHVSFPVFTPPQHTHTHTILCLLLFSGVWMSNCSGPQREGRIERKREKGVQVHINSVWEPSGAKGGVKKMDGMFVCWSVCVEFLCICCGCEEGEKVRATEAQWDHWSAESAMCALN